MFRVLAKEARRRFRLEWQSKIKYWANKEAVGILAKVVSNHDDAFAYPYNEQGKDTSYSTWALFCAPNSQNDALKRHLMSTGAKYLWGS